MRGRFALRMAPKGRGVNTVIGRVAGGRASTEDATKRSNLELRDICLDEAEHSEHAGTQK